MQRQLTPISKFSIFFLIAAFVIPNTSWPGSSGKAFAQSQTSDQGADQAQEPWERFADFNEDSQITINHSPLTETLKGSIMPFGRSKNRKGNQGKKEYFKNSHIPKILNGSPSRLEGNRLMLHAFSEEHKDFFWGYQQGLEVLSERRALSALNKNEQLAYWLNLYNVVVINKLIEEYPISRLKTLRNEGQSYWDQKVTSVEGVPLSLTDIEQILIHNWDNPLVIYGLFQGSIGGPTLNRGAFTGKEVWQQLETSASEFVNSNRGVIPKKNKLDVSLFYQWTKGAFGNSDQALLDHINAYARPEFMGDISHLTTIRYKYYDWYVADLLEGRTHGGDFSNSSQGLPATGTTEWYLAQTGLWDTLKTLPISARELVVEAIVSNEIPRIKKVVTTKECAPGDPCGENNAADNDPDVQ